MAEQWVSAAKALEIVGDPFALCARLHAGLIEAEARLIIWNDKHENIRSVPKEFWWARGHEALQQDWAAGDFSTWIDKRFEIQVFGVRFGLDGVLALLEPEKRFAVAQSISVIGNPAWLVASDARRLAYTQFNMNPSMAAVAIQQYAKLGFVIARAVEARGSATGKRNSWSWQEREWDVPKTFWEDFMEPDRSVRDWDTGRFSGRNAGPNQFRFMEISGVHFLRSSLDCLRPAELNSVSTEPVRGRKRVYDWEAATNKVWGEIFRGNLIPNKQADIETALQNTLAKGDSQPGEATVRPYAQKIWQEIEKA